MLKENLYHYEHLTNHLRDALAQIGISEICRRGVYDDCQVPGNQQLSPLEAGGKNSILEQKKLRKIQIHHYGQTKSCYSSFRHAQV